MTLPQATNALNPTPTTTTSESPASQTVGGNGTITTAGTAPDSRRDDTTAKGIERPAYLRNVLDDAELLLQYAAEAGLDLDDSVRKAILHARAVGVTHWTEDTEASLLSAFTKLVARVRPVTAQSLRACGGKPTKRATRRILWVGLVLAAVVLPFSLVSFVTSGISEAIRKDIVTANELAVKLTAQLESISPDQGPVSVSALPPGLSKAEVVTELQQFAATIRAIDARAQQLNFFVLRIENDPYPATRGDPEVFHQTFELPVPLANLVAAKDQKIEVHQKVRHFAQSIIDDVSVFYGAITTCILPILYALVGTCAFLLRAFEQELRTRSFVPSLPNSARFLIAAIGGSVVGLFNNFSVSAGASVPPLAIAFLVGYAVDVFFSFLEGLIQSLTKTKDNVKSSSLSGSS